MSNKKIKVIVTRKWLLDFANTIYNPKTKQFLNLCRGHLTNGPDPKDSKRSMHCGLGELYFRLTGKHPKGITEGEVINKVIEHSSLLSLVVAETDLLAKAVSKLKAPQVYGLKSRVEDLKDLIVDFDPWGDERVDIFQTILSSIPHENDDGSFMDTDSVVRFRNRSKRVAAVLRTAAKLLPA